METQLSGITLSELAKRQAKLLPVQNVAARIAAAPGLACQPHAGGE